MNRNNLICIYITIKKFGGYL